MVSCCGVYTSQATRYHAAASPKAAKYNYYINQFIVHHVSLAVLGVTPYIRTAAVNSRSLYRPFYVCQ